MKLLILLMELVVLKLYRLAINLAGLQMIIEGNAMIQDTI